MSDTGQAFPIDEIVPLLNQVSLFEGLPREDLERIAGLVEGETVAAGDLLFLEGDPGETFYIVFQGAIEIIKESAGGDQKLAVKRAGGSFGEMSLLNDAPRSATARAVQESQLMAIARDDFTGLLSQGSLDFRMMTGLSKALRALNVRFAALERRAAAGGPASETPDVGGVSRVIQRAILPRVAPQVSGFDIAAGTNLEDAGNGATIWDTFSMQDDRVGLAILRVGGNALPPAYHLGLARALMREVATRSEDLGQVMARLNHGLAESAIKGADQHVEGALIALGESVEWCSAGAVSGTVLKRGGERETLASSGPPLGMMAGFRYGSRSIQLGAGEVLMALSTSPGGLAEGAADLTAQLQGKPAGDIVQKIHEAIEKAHEGSGTRETSVVFVRKS